MSDASPAPHAPAAQPVQPEPSPPNPPAGQHVDAFAESAALPDGQVSDTVGSSMNGDMPRHSPRTNATAEPSQARFALDRTDVLAAEAMGASERTATAQALAEAKDKARSGVRRAIDNAPLRTKVTLLALAAVVCGAGVAGAQTQLSLQVMPSILLLVAVAGLLIGLGQWWIAGPVDRLAARLESLARSRRTVALRDLPLRRSDEVGRIASAMHKICLAAIRCDYDSRQLRRTLDQRVQNETRKAVAMLERMAMRDPLTELGNRRALDARFPDLFALAQAQGQDLTCIMFDLDNFKAVNDQLGHHAGDEMLVLLAGLIQAHVRSDDLAARLGGDEMCLIMPGADTKRAADLADRMRVLFDQEAKRMNPDGPHAGVSAGVASLSKDKPTTHEELLDMADQRLYEAKRSGKGRTGR
ncbi:MAG: GGDEF domain-containing protein [Planctomycetota bacterium]